MALYNRKVKIEKFCENCGVIFRVLPSRKKKKFCSKSCAGTYGIKTGKIKKVKAGWNAGIKTPKEVRDKQSKARLKNPTRYWLGKKRPDMRNKNSKRSWKEYVNRHNWIRRKLGKPIKCEICGGKATEWSNKNHLYKKILSDWQRLCHKCHKKYDRDILKIKA